MQNKTYHQQKTELPTIDLQRKFYHPQKDPSENPITRHVKEKTDYLFWVYFALGVAICAANIK